MSLRRQGDARRPPGRADPRPRPGRLRAVLLGRRRFGGTGPGQLRGRQRLPGRAGRAAPGRGLPATSVAWGPWAGGGMAADDAVTERVRRGGLSALAPDLGARRAAAGPRPRRDVLAVADVDWARFAPLFTATVRVPSSPNSRKRSGRWRSAGGGARPRGGGAGPLRQRLAAAGAGGAQRLALDLVRRRRRPCSGTPAEAVERRAGLQRPGLRLADRGRAAQPAGRATGLTLPATLVFDYPDPGRAGRAALRAELPGQRQRPIAAPAAAAAAVDERADRDRRHGLPLPGRRAQPRGAVGAAGRRHATRISEFPDRPRLGPGRPLRPRPGPAGHHLRTRGRLPARRGRVRRRVLRHLPARGAGHGPAAAAAARGRPGRRSSGPGIDPAALRGSRTGVFAGANGQDYGCR